MQKYTLKELADIGAKAAYMAVEGTKMSLIDSSEDQPAREAFVKAILDAIGYEFQKDDEREAFDAWCETNHKLATTDQFEAWKAGREELRKSQSLDKQPSYSMPPSYAGITLLGTKPNEPEWIPWNGGECPLSDKVKKWEYKERWNHNPVAGRGSPKSYRWKHFESGHDIIAYRVWE